MKPVFNKVEIPVLTKDGALVRWRKIYNAPLAVLWPELVPDRESNRYPVVIVDWMPNQGDKPPTISEVVAPIPYGGRLYRALYWSSGSIKKGQMLAVDVELGDPLAGLARKVEDYARLQSVVLSSGFYGAGHGTLSVSLTPKAPTRIGHYMVYDGHGLIRESVARRLLYGSSPIELGDQAPSYQVSQWLDMEDEAVRKEVMAVVEKAVMAWAKGDIPETVFAKDPELERLRDLDEEMRLHPYAARRATRKVADALFRLAVAPDWGQQTRVAVPTPQVVAPGIQGKALVWRFPVDGPNVLAVEVEPQDGWDEAVKNAEVVQYRLNIGTNAWAKGTLTIVPDNLIGSDVVLSEEDVKLGDIESGVHDDAMIVFTAHYAPGCAVGMPPKLFKDRAGGDFDGDMVGIADVNAMPATWENYKRLPLIFSKKIKKTTTEYSERAHAEFAVRSMANIVGSASNVLARYCSMAKSDRPWETFKMQSDEAALRAINYLIKVGTDMYKSVLDVEKAHGELQRLISRFDKRVGRPPWLRWAKDPEAFVTRFPKVAPKELVTPGNDFDLTEQFTGPVAVIAREVLPAIEWLAGEEGTLRMARRPIQEFRSWALEHKALREKAMALHAWYVSAAPNVDWTDVKAAQAFKAEAQLEFKEAAEEVGDRWALAQALWWVAHSSRSGTATGASVFYLAPEEARRIIREKPGLASGGSTREVECTLLGLDKTLTDCEDIRLEVEVKIELVPYRDQMIERRNVLADGRPIGYVAYDSRQHPPEGRYQAHIVRVAPGRKAWNAVLIAK